MAIFNSYFDITRGCRFRLRCGTQKFEDFHEKSSQAISVNTWKAAKSSAIFCDWHSLKKRGVVFQEDSVLL
jgi:hypothetical protein